MYTESHFFLQSSKFVYLSGQLLTHFKLFHHILWLLLYINPYPLNRYIKDKKLLILPLTLVAINMFNSLYISHSTKLNNCEFIY